MPEWQCTDIDCIFSVMTMFVSQNLTFYFTANSIRS